VVVGRHHRRPLRWSDDEILFTEGDLLGKTAGELTALKSPRDRDHLTGPG
jgi:hypothetical protein